MEFKLATINSFFDGISIEDLSAFQWLMVHAKTFMGTVDDVRKYQKQRSGLHPVCQILEQQSPDILVVNEVIRYNDTSETIHLLNERGYKGAEIDAPVEMTADFKRGTLVACRYDSTPIELNLQRFPGGRFSGMKIPELNLVVIGVQGTPFNWLIRKHQIRSIFSYFEKFESEGYRVVVAGDFNTGIQNSDLILPDNILHFTERTFPSPSFYEKLKDENSISSAFMRTLLKFRKGPRSLDHILYSKDLSLKRGVPIETLSDHCALFAHFEA
jgi:hypothetical protein